MTKSATTWRPTGGTGELDNSYEGGSLLLESGGGLLLETGGSLLLEDSNYDPKALTTWTTEAKSETAWFDQGLGEPNLDNVGLARAMEDGTARLMEDGTPRVFEDADIDAKSVTTWTESDS